METAFFDDLLPEIETHYAVSTQRAGRMIGGVLDGRLRRTALRDDAARALCGALLLSPAILRR